ncbi:bacillithiol biosynthesis deacetylase BshB2 [Alicyclobacillus fastidiosus]|uniref:Bacillithiol biosynthesis deacetylase BshB2 n=1 Tax=Alicyclobacillus fastidiosus TaxID=392011 RepID=A0ABY6ZDR4_9BACL|nr:bacillithiol biosynthesis deacetylase BshB2 [Alicyclobacillus fastidiosus]WAH41029.1 bacillithiol biosynthesis deacetylase BshB2 [Alicyclobacillus fastidiosus]GMA62552.1 bacillithiol biosynthesis deacetylase BshB2 [Alicyclobacillus fastidiosus]
MERHVLVVFPHPDDETMATGGVIALHAAAGSPITYACFTLGEMGRNMGDPPFANRETLPQIRERELREACRHLGVGDLRLMGFRDKTLEFEDPEKLTGLISGLIEEVNPSLVITYYPGYCVHPDHEAIAHATVRAIAKLPAQVRPVLQCQAFSRGHEEVLGPCDVVLDTSAVWEKVYLAWKAHKSQTATYIAHVEKELHGDETSRKRAMERFSRYGLYTYTF